MESLPGAAGATIAVHEWRPETAPKATVVIAHGLAEHAGRYGHVVDTLIPAGYEVVIPDHRGHGRSTGTRSQIDRMAHVVADLDRVVDRAGAPVFLLGHSMGGLVAIAYALDHQAKLRGLALSNPLAELALPARQRLLIRALSAVRPDQGAFEVEGGAISRDADEVRRYDEDPLNHRGKIPVRTLDELLRTIERVRRDAARLTLPLLVQLATADRLAPPAGGRLIHDRAGSADKTLHVYDGYFHEIYNEAPADRERPLGDLRAWLDARVELEH